MYQLCIVTGFLYGNLPSILTSLYVQDHQTIFYALYSTCNISLLFYFFYKSFFLQYYNVETSIQPYTSHWGFYFFLGLLNETILYGNDTLFTPFYVEHHITQQCIPHYYPTNRFCTMPLFVFLCALVYEHYRIHSTLYVYYMNCIVNQPRHYRTRSNSPFAVVDNILE